MNLWSDGAPLPTNAPALPTSPTSPTYRTDKAVDKAVSRIRQFEGPRGYSNRIVVYMRHAMYMMAIILCCAVTEYCTKGVANANGGGRWMLFSATAILAAGAMSTLFYANLRKDIIEKVRHYIFGIAVFPGTLVAIFIKATSGVLGGDAFAGTLGMALPVVFLCTVILPALVFVKEMAGIRTLHRSRLDDQEAVALWTRQDGLQR